MENKKNNRKLSLELFLYFLSLHCNHYHAEHGKLYSGRGDLSTDRCNRYHSGDSADGGQIEHSAYDPCIRHTGNSIHKMSGTNLRRKIQTEKQNGCN